MLMMKRIPHWGTVNYEALVPEDWLQEIRKIVKMLFVPVSLLCFIHIYYKSQPFSRADLLWNQWLSHIWFLSTWKTAIHEVINTEKYRSEFITFYLQRENMKKKERTCDKFSSLLVIYSNKYIYCWKSKESTLKQQKNMCLSEENISQI